MPTIGFRGQIYANTSTATNPALRRFTTVSTKLSRCIIQVEGNPQAFGDGATYPVYYAADSKLELMNVDISTLYFCNFTGDLNGTVRIVGIYAD